MISKKTMLHINSRDRISGSVENFTVSIGDNPKLHGIKAIQLHSVEMTNSLYNTHKDFQLKALVVKEPNQTPGEIQETIIANGKNTLWFLFTDIPSNRNFYNHVDLIANIGYTYSSFRNSILTQLQQKINSFINNNALAPTTIDLTFYNDNSNNYKWIVTSSRTSSSIEFEFNLTPSLTDYFVNESGNPMSSVFHFPRSNYYWKRHLSTDASTWLQLQSEYPNSIFLYDTINRIVPGNYNAAQLESHINGIFTTISNQQYVTPPHILLEFDSTTFKSVIRRGIEINMRVFMYETRGAKELGFTNFNPNYINLNSSSTSYTSSNIIRLQRGILYLHCPTLPSVSINSKGQVNSVIAKLRLGSVPLGSPYMYINDSDSLMNFENRYSDITNLDFFLTDADDGSTPDLNGVDYSMTFIIYT